MVSSSLLALFLGLSIAILSYAAYRGMKSKMMLFISIGFGLFTIGSIVEGLLFEFLGYGLEQVHAIDSTISIAGLLIVLYALRIVKERPIALVGGEPESST